MTATQSKTRRAYRQGELLFVPVSSDELTTLEYDQKPQKYPAWKKLASNVIREGEATGHKHEVIEQTAGTATMLEPARQLLAVYPKLKGKIPQEIEANYCTGIYIPAHNVPKLLDCMDIRLRQFIGLLLILEYAAKNGFAYWEATDLPLEPRTIYTLKHLTFNNHEEIINQKEICFDVLGQNQFEKNPNMINWRKGL